MAINLFVTLDGETLYPETPIAYGYQRIVGDDSRNLAADLQITHRGWKRTFTLTRSLATPTDLTQWETLATTVTPMPYVGERGQVFDVVVRGSSFELQTALPSELWRLTLELEEV
jgi:hypothetical protein